MANTLQLETQFIPHLRTQFSRGGVMLFTGAGFSTGAFNKDQRALPTAVELTRELWRLCYGNDPFDSTTQLQDIYDAALQMDRGRVEGLLRSRLTVDVERNPEFYGTLLSMPWARIYTLNIDDLIEKTLALFRSHRPIRSISATSGKLTEMEDDHLSIVHLNGDLQDVPGAVTFGRSQYAARSVNDPFYTALRHDLVSRPFVFVGSNLEEGPMWQHLALRGHRPGRGERELRPRSYLVTPTLNRSKQALLSQYQIEWLQMTAEEFCEDVLAVLQDAREEGTTHLAQKYEWTRAHGSKLIRISELPIGKPEPTEYLLGAEPGWPDAQHRRIAERDCFQQITEEINRIRAGTTVDEFLIVTGTAGTGKSSALMAIALQMEAAGLPTAWLQSSFGMTAYELRRALEADPGIGLLIVPDADVFDRAFSRLVRDAIATNPRLIVVCECRSTKVHRIVDINDLDGIRPTEYTVPGLGDSDIDAILDVLERENRLGVLRGKSRDERRRIFQAESGRQMLVAMYKATHGQDFEEKAIAEFRELDVTQQLLYGIICVAHSHRFNLDRAEIAIAFGDDIDDWPRALDALVRRKVVLQAGVESYKTRHRQIAQFLYNNLVREGAIVNIVRALIKIAGTKASPHSGRHDRASRMLASFVSHNFIFRTVGLHPGRQIYSEFEQLLNWDYHYWLHRGALELESDNLGVAENFLNQAKSIEPADVFVDNELAYLKFKKANHAPRDSDSPALVREALDAFYEVAARRRDQRAHIAHIAGRQGLLWSSQAQMTDAERREFLERLLRQVRAAIPDDNERMLPELETDIQKEILRIAVVR